MSSADKLIQAIELQILTPLIGLIGAAGLAFFIWGVGQFFYYVDNETERTKGKQHMLWGVIGLAIMVGVFGILNVICSTIGCAR